MIPSNLMEGGVIRPVGKVTVEEGETRPPNRSPRPRCWPRWSHASRYVEDKSLKAALDDDESHSGGIGTPATRADTIESSCAPNSWNARAGNCTPPRKANASPTWWSHA